MIASANPRWRQNICDAAGGSSQATGALVPVARKGQDAPEVAGGKFASFDQIVLPDWGGVVMLATVRGVPVTKNRGIWTTDAGGAMQLVARTGDSVSVRGVAKIIKSLKIFRVAAGVQGQSRNFDAETANLAYQAWFTDGSWAVFRVVH